MTIWLGSDFGEAGSSAGTSASVCTATEETCLLSAIIYLFSLLLTCFKHTHLIDLNVANQFESKKQKFKSRILNNEHFFIISNLRKKIRG